MKIDPPLDPGFASAALLNRDYRDLARADPGARVLHIALGRPDGTVFRHETPVLGEDHPESRRTFRHVERTLKFLLWQKGGSRVWLAGAPELAGRLARVYSAEGERAFDHAFMGGRVYGEPFSVRAAAVSELPAERQSSVAAGRHLEGCRIGFDLGGSDRKVAALIDGRVVFSEETAWDPYFRKDPAYHVEGVDESLRRAAAHLPRVDAIGGSAAGVYVNNEVRVASLFRGVPEAAFEARVRRMFFDLQARWGGVPFEVVNDGEVTALAASMSLGVNSVLGISMGTSLAAGYVTPEGKITSWLNELAFAPIDHRDDAPRDEWSGDVGCGARYFSQQGVARLAERAGFVFAEETGLPERLVAVQRALAGGDPRAVSVYDTIGTCFGHALALYAECYELEHVLILGRVTSGEGGGIILGRAREVLDAEFPEISRRLALHTPDETGKRHGQAVAAASLPSLRSATA